MKAERDRPEDLEVGLAPDWWLDLLLPEKVRLEKLDDVLDKASQICDRFKNIFPGERKSFANVDVCLAFGGFPKNLVAFLDWEARGVYGRVWGLAEISVIPAGGVPNGHLVHTERNRATRAGAEQCHMLIADVQVVQRSECFVSVSVRL